MSSLFIHLTIDFWTMIEMLWIRFCGVTGGEVFWFDEPFMGDNINIKTFSELSFQDLSFENVFCVV